jgi:hypothetical protein
MGSPCGSVLGRKRTFHDISTANRRGIWACLFRLMHFPACSCGGSRILTLVDTATAPGARLTGSASISLTIPICGVRCLQGP